MAQEAVVSWKKFCIILAGKTYGAHQAFVAKLKSIGQIKVNSVEKSDYLLVFCPITTRVGTDISEAMEKLPGGKPAILVVMHHTFDPDQVVSKSRRQVEKYPNVYFTVDCLFHKGKLLKCKCNDNAWSDVQMCLPRGPTVSQVFKNYTNNNLCFLQWLAVFLVILLILLLILTMNFDQIFGVGRKVNNDST